MTLFLATILLGALLMIEGLSWLTLTQTVEKAYKGFLRSKFCAYVFFGGATVWVLWHITQLGEADFGQYKKLLFILFLAISLGCFIFVRDFLAVRGWAILMLLLSSLFLDAAFLQDPPGRLLLVGFVYVLILMALYFAAVPYKMRDLCDWAFAKPKRAKTIGAVLAAYGFILAITAFTY